MPTRKVAVVTLCYAEDDLGDKLLVGYNRKRGGWELPGGKSEVGEPLVRTAIRETGEEAGVKIEGLHRCMVIDGDPDWLIVAYVAAVIEAPDPLAVPEPHNHFEWRWARQIPHKCQPREEYLHWGPHLDALSPPMRVVYDHDRQHNEHGTRQLEDFVRLGHPWTPSGKPPGPYHKGMSFRVPPTYAGPGGGVRTITEVWKSPLGYWAYRLVDVDGSSYELNHQDLEGDDNYRLV